MHTHTQRKNSPTDRHLYARTVINIGDGGHLLYKERKRERGRENFGHLDDVDAVWNTNTRVHFWDKHF